MNIIHPYKKASSSYKNLRDYLKGRKVRKDVIVNWGDSDLDVPKGVTCFNKPSAIANAIDKVKTFKLFREHGVSTPDWTTDKEEAQSWFDEGSIVIARQAVKANSGKGIQVFDPEEFEQELPTAKLYTKYLRKKKEFRVHVFNGVVIDYTEKKAKKDKPEHFNKYIRSHSMGWVYCREGVERNEDVCKQAIKAVYSLGLDFGAVDVCLYRDRPYVLEVNTAPGIEGLTLMQYVIALEEMGIVSC